ncbi:MAG: dockerin type I domain-containing protein [Pirellula sp.]
MANPKRRLELRQRAVHGAVRNRRLQFDRLEDRRLMAGLEVFVFDDWNSARQSASSTSALPDKVVYVDFNSDGVQQANEPLGVTDANGVARFGGLKPGNYSVRLLGESRTLVQTTATLPAPGGTWLSNLGLQQSLRWESDDVAWFTTGNAIQRLNVETGSVQQRIPFDGAIKAAAMIDLNNGIAIVEQNLSQRLVAFDLSTGSLEDLPVSVERPSQIFSVDGYVYVRGKSANGEGLFSVANGAEMGAGEAWSIGSSPVVDGLTPGSIVHTSGGQSLVVQEPTVDGGQRISSYRVVGGVFELTAERAFAGPEGASIRFSSSSPAGEKIVLTSANGVMVLDNSPGLPTLANLVDAAGPSVFDSSRGVLITSSRSNPSRILGWSTQTWVKQFDVLFSDAGSRMAVDKTSWAMGYLNDTLVGIRDGSLYRHSLALPGASAAAISEGVIHQVAIGVRSRGYNAKPTLQALPSISTQEDSPIAIARNWFDQSAKDRDGESIFYVIRESNGSIGTWQWAAASGGVFSPSPNANGIDSVVVQAYDGRDWSLPQTLTVQVQPVNDPPEGIDTPNSLFVDEGKSGVSLGAVRVIDKDSDSQYRYTVSDGRFLIDRGVLVLAPGASLDYESEQAVVLVISATEVALADSIKKTVTVQVRDQNDPPTGMLLTGSGQVPEKKPGYVVGNISVIDPDMNEVYDVTVSDPRFEVVGSVVRLKPGTSVTYSEPGWIDLTFTATSRNYGTSLQRADRLRVIPDATPYHNDINPMDVDGDGKVTPLDPLTIINYINTNGPGVVKPRGEGESYGDLDVDGDGKVSPLDILIIINAMNRPVLDGSGEGSGSQGGLVPEGESSKGVPPPLADALALPGSVPVSFEVDGQIEPLKRTRRR